jgi:hypothetical protein
MKILETVLAKLKETRTLLVQRIEEEATRIVVGQSFVFFTSDEALKVTKHYNNLCAIYRNIEKQIIAVENQIINDSVEKVKAKRRPPLVRQNARLNIFVDEKNVAHVPRLNLEMLNKK